MCDRDPLKSVPPYSRNMVRKAVANAAISSDRLLGFSTPIAEIVKKSGYKSEAEYWRDLMSEPMTFSAFRLSLEAPHLGPAGSNDGLQLFLKDTMKLMASSRQSWVFEAVDGKRMIMPADAVRWLLSLPMRASLVPPGLKTFVEGETIARDSVLPKIRKTGKTSPVRDRVIQEMEYLSADELKQMTEKCMEYKFRASRDTCRKARKEIQSRQSRSAKTTKST